MDNVSITEDDKMWFHSLLTLQVPKTLRESAGIGQTAEASTKVLNNYLQGHSKCTLVATELKEE